MTEERPVQALHDQIMERYDCRPVSYRELEQRYGDEVDNFQETFASAVNTFNYRNGPERDVDVFIYMDDDDIDTLAAFRDYLDDTDSWYLSRSFRNGNSDMEEYQEDVPELTDETLDNLYEEDLLSKLGGITLVTDQGWWAMYHNDADGIYVPREPLDR